MILFTCKVKSNRINDPISISVKLRKIHALCKIIFCRFQNEIHLTVIIIGAFMFGGVPVKNPTAEVQLPIGLFFIELNHCRVSPTDSLLVAKIESIIVFLGSDRICIGIVWEINEEHGNFTIAVGRHTAG